MQCVSFRAAHSGGSFASLLSCLCGSEHLIKVAIDRLKFLSCLCGSSENVEQKRDVDIVVILPPEQFNTDAATTCPTAAHAAAHAAATTMYARLMPFL